MILALVTVLYQLQINAKVEDDITGTLFDTVFKINVFPPYGIKTGQGVHQNHTRNKILTFNSYCAFVARERR